MSITAQHLSKSGAKGKVLDSIIREQLAIIDEKLIRADRTWGRNVVTHNLPTCISLPGLEKQDAQRILYSTIIRSLDKRGFDTRINLTDELTVLYIAWTTDLAGEEIEAMNTVIVQRVIAGDEIKRFTATTLRKKPK